jgi:hypothetical protein
LQLALGYIYDKKQIDGRFGHFSIIFWQIIEIRVFSAFYHGPLHGDIEKTFRNFLGMQIS